jgi:hypothetical protein
MIAGDYLRDLSGKAARIKERESTSEQLERSGASINPRRKTSLPRP